jgi:hypothetical protein
VSDSHYQQRLEAGECTYPGCDEPLCSGSSYCEEHWEDHKRRDREYRQRKRDARREAGLCLECPGDKPARVRHPDTTCIACRVRRRRLTRADGTTVGGVGKRVDKDQRIAAATKVGEDGRERYHGQQKRGNQPHIQLDEQDLGYARDALEAGLAGLYVYEEAVRAKTPRIQREDIRSAALHHLNRATGHVDDVLGRRDYFGAGHVKLRHGKRDGE